MTDDKKRMSAVDRRSMKILANSTKASGPNNARVAERLEKAAGTGDPTDYKQAERSFDALPAIERRRIGTHAEKQAERHGSAAARPPSDGIEGLIVSRVEPPKRPKVDDTLEWQPMIPDHSPATDPLPAPSVPRPKAAAQPSGGAARPAGQPARGAPGNPPPAPARGRPGTKPPAKRAAVDQDVEEQGWNWQQIPEDPVSRSRSKKPTVDDPISELRRQMLGDDSKRR